ncbi:hypothetical protein QQ054_21340 [Oscillatoria amoena NRMC-F 0135]|nr:hypothetical protein [Oscillatoria amoena NRMC-F 0135]
MKCLLYFLLTLTVLKVFSQDNTDSTGTQQKPNSYITFSFGLSIVNGTFNSFKIGNVEQFYQHITGRTDVKLDDGAIGFRYVAFGYRGATEKLIMGVDFRAVQTHQTQAIAGTNQGGTGFNAGMNFSATFLELAVIVGPNTRGGCICLEVGPVSGFMSGAINIYSSPNQEYVQKGAFGAGLLAGLHLDFMLGKSFLINAKMGYRQLKIDESHEDGSGELKTFYVNGQDGETVEVDWSGHYASVGISLVLALKPKKG